MCSITLGLALVNILVHHQDLPIALPYIPPLFSASRCRFSENWIIVEGGYPLDASGFFEHLLAGGLAPEFAFFAGLFEFVFRRHESDVSNSANSGDTTILETPYLILVRLLQNPVKCR